jgi:hypothetical protein
MSSLLTKPNAISENTKTSNNISILQKGNSTCSITTSSFNVNNTIIDSTGNLSIYGHISLPNLSLSNIPSNTYNKLYSKLNNDNQNELYWEDKPILIQDNDIFVSSIDVSTRNISIGGIDYTWPPNNGSASNVLTTDGEGILSWSDPNAVLSSLSNLNDTYIDNLATEDILKIESIDGSLKWINTKSLSNLTINNTIIGGSIPADGTFTTLVATSGNITGSLLVENDINVSNDLIVTGDLTIESATSLNDTLEVDGDVTLLSNLIVYGTTDLTDLNVSGTISGNLSGNLTGSILTGSQPNITSLGTLNGLSIGGNVTINSNINVDLIDNSLSAVSFNTTGKQGILNFVTTNSSEGITMSGTLNVTGAVTMNKFTFPTTDGLNGQVLQTNGDGVLTWQTNNQIVIENDGNNYLITSTGNNLLNGEANLIFDGSLLTVTGSQQITSTLQVTGLTTLTGGVNLPDSTNLTLGTDNDITIVHSGTNATITNTVGNIIFNATDNTEGNGNIIFNLIDNQGETGIIYKNSDNKQIFLLNSNGTVLFAPSSTISLDTNLSSALKFEGNEDMLVFDTTTSNEVVLVKSNLTLEGSTTKITDDNNILIKDNSNSALTISSTAFGNLITIDTTNASNETVIISCNFKVIGNNLMSYVFVNITEYNLNINERIIGVDTSLDSVRLYLPSATTVGAGTVFYIKNESGNASPEEGGEEGGEEAGEEGGNTITISTTTETETIDGQESFVIDDSYGYISVYSNGSNWFTF